MHGSPATPATLLPYGGAHQGFRPDRTEGGTELPKTADIRTLSYVGVVYPRDLDHMGHMNVSRYTAMFDEATWVFFASRGIDRAYMEREKRGMAALTQESMYQKELFAGDVVEVRTVLIEVREKTLRFRHEMRLLATGEMVATSELISAHLDRAARRACPFPPALRTQLVAAVQPDEI